MEQKGFQLPAVKSFKTIGLEAHGELTIIQDSACILAELEWQPSPLYHTGLGFEVRKDRHF